MLLSSASHSDFTETLRKEEVCDSHTFKPKRQVTGIAEDRHLENLVPMDKRDGIFPVRETLVVPHLPKDPTDQCCESNQPQGFPIAARGVRENCLFTCDHL